jgi:hypothetical protein
MNFPPVEKPNLNQILGLPVSGIGREGIKTE